MQGFTLKVKTRLALGPAAFVCMLLQGLSVAHAAASPPADPRQAVEIYRKVISAETRMVKAMTAKDERGLEKIGAELGILIDKALARRKAGGSVSPCDIAMHSLTFVAVSAGQALGSNGEMRKALVEDARGASSDFTRDMRACETFSGQKIGNHLDVEKALRAL
jgi:hypothetical protein